MAMQRGSAWLSWCWGQCWLSSHWWQSWAGCKAALPAAGWAQVCRVSMNPFSPPKAIELRSMAYQVCIKILTFQIKLCDCKSDLFTEKIQHDKMQVFGRKVWKDEKVRGGDSQTDVDEYFISQKVHTNFNTTNSSSHSLGSRTANQQTIWSQN